MSAPTSIISCTGCDYSGRDEPRFIQIRYRTAGGQVLTGASTKGWCHACSDYLDIEDLDVEPERMRERLAEAARQKGQAEGVLEELPGEVANLSGLRHLAEKRAAGARCLRCWSDKTAPVAFKDGVSEDFQHECGGKLTTAPDPTSVSEPTDVIYVLDDEGELIEELRGERFAPRSGE